MRASRSNRSRLLESQETAAGRILIATSRSSLASSAWYTSPIPPTPSGATISYGPRRVPGERAIRGRDYTSVKPSLTAQGSNSFHEKAARSQDGFFVFPIVDLYFNRAASVAVLPS